MVRDTIVDTIGVPRVPAEKLQKWDSNELGWHKIK
jgi:hypothetical protein